MAKRVIEDLGDWAEDSFSRLCAAAGVTRNKSTQDRSGWDYIIQFPHPEVAGLPADLQPAEESARIQVKSKKKGPPNTAVKLTNALRFTNEPGPCFVVLFVATDRCEPVRIYAKHFWTDEIKVTLHRARLAHGEGRDDLHKIMLPLRFKEQDEHTTDLLPWIAATIGSVSNYPKAKSTLRRNAGFEDGFVHGTVSFATEDLPAFIDHQLGLRQEAPISDITIKNRRFGIDARTPLFSGKPDLIRLQAHPIPCRVRVRTFDAADIWLDGDLYVPMMTGLPRDLSKIRVVADFLEILFSGSGAGTVNFGYKGTDQRTIPMLRALVDVARRIEDGPLQIQVSSEGRPSLPLTVSLPASGEIKELQQLSNVITCLETVVTAATPTQLTVSLVEIYTAWNEIRGLNGLICGTDFHARFELQVKPDIELRPAASIYIYDYVDVGAWTLMVVIRRPITKFTMEGSQGDFYCGHARVVEAIIRRGRGVDFLPELRGLYEQSVKLEKHGVLELFGGDYRAMSTTSEHGDPH